MVGIVVHLRIVLLSFLYAMALNEINVICQVKGHSPVLGLLHSTKGSRPALALDLLELWRPSLDRLALTLINRNQLSVECFEMNTEQCLLNKVGKDLLVRNYRQFIDGRVGIKFVDATFAMLDMIAKGPENILGE